MFKLFFTNLTTSITEIELYFARVKPVRNIPVHLKSFQKLVDVARNEEKAIVARSSKKSQVAKGKKKASVEDDSDNNDNDDNDNDNDNDDNNDNDNDNNDNDNDAFNDLARKGTMSALLRILAIDERIFLQDYKKLYVHLGFKKPYDREYRVNIHLGVRLLTMSGLEWNIDTKSKYRDQAHIAIAAALEYRIIENYRPELFLGCHFARKMRTAIRDYLTSVGAVHPKRSNSHVGIKEWSFPDNISTEGDVEGDAEGDAEGDGERDGERGAANVANAPAPYDAEFLRRTLNDTIAEETRQKKDPVATIINELLNNPLLSSSEPGVPNGTVEITAYQDIMALGRVRFYRYCDQI